MSRPDMVPKTLYIRYGGIGWGCFEGKSRSLYFGYRYPMRFQGLLNTGTILAWVGSLCPSPLASLMPSIFIFYLTQFQNCDIRQCAYARIAYYLYDVKNFFSYTLFYLICQCQLFVAVNKLYCRGIVPILYGSTISIYMPQIQGSIIMPYINK